MSFLRPPSILKNTFRRAYCRCPENNNLFSTTSKVNLFTLLCTIYITGRFIHNEYYDKAEENRKEMEERLNKRLDQLQKKE